MAVVQIHFTPWASDLYEGFRAFLYDAYRAEGYAFPQEVPSFRQAMEDIDFMVARASTNPTLFARNPVGWSYDLRSHPWDDYLKGVRGWYGVDVSVRLERITSEVFGYNQERDVIAVIAEEDRWQMQSLLADHPGVYLREDGALLPTPYAVDGRPNDIQINVHIEESDLGVPVDVPAEQIFDHNYSVVKVGTLYINGGFASEPWTSESVTDYFYRGARNGDYSSSIRHATDEAVDLLCTTGTQNAAATRCIVPTEHQMQSAVARGNSTTKGRVILLEDTAPTTAPIPREHMVLLPHHSEKGMCCTMPVLALGLNASRTGFIPWRAALDKAKAKLSQLDSYSGERDFWSAPFDRVMVQRTANGWNAVIALALPVSLREYWKPDRSHPQMLFTAYTVTLSHTFQELNEELHRYRNLPGELIEAIYGNRTLSAFLQQVLLTVQGIPKALARLGGDFDNFSLRDFADKKFKLPKGHLLRSFGPMFSQGFREFCKTPRSQHGGTYGKRRMAKIAYDLLSQTDKTLCLTSKVRAALEEVVEVAAPSVRYRHLEV